MTAPRPVSLVGKFVARKDGLGRGRVISAHKNGRALEVILPSGRRVVWYAKDVETLSKRALPIPCPLCQSGYPRSFGGQHFATDTLTDCPDWTPGDDS